MPRQLREGEVSGDDNTSEGRDAVERIIAPLREDYRRHGIKHGPQPPGRPLTPYVTCGPLADHIIDRLDEHATKRGMTRSALARAILECVVDDDLFAAVLDDE